MIAARQAFSSAKVLRVAVRSDDSARLQELVCLVHDAALVVVASAREADVIVYDGPSETEEGDASRAVVIGRATGDAAAILPRDASSEQVAAAVRAVAAGLVVRAAVQRNSAFGPAPEEKLEKLLTPRELEVLAAIGDGLGNKAIARRLDISLHTVKFHVEAILRKLDARSRAEAVAKGWSRSHEALDL